MSKPASVSKMEIKATIENLESYLLYFDKDNEKNSFSGITKEFEDMWKDFYDLPSNEKKTSLAELYPTKNRYHGIGPYDNKRIVLDDQDKEQNPDGYINASPIAYFGAKRKYIAAMGPVQATINDFWEMIRQQNVKTIAMLCNTVEGGRSKCAPYWPLDDKKPLLGNNFSVSLMETIKFEDFLLRKLLLTYPGASGEHSRVVNQLQYIDWPDHGRPNVAEKVVGFVEKLQQSNDLAEAEKQFDSPILVHCSAGCGRTGTLIAVNILREILSSRSGHHRLLKEPLQGGGIRQFVLELRQQRMNLLEDPGQYRLLHRCLAIYSRQAVLRLKHFCHDESL